jgi:hypothetical protein
MANIKLSKAELAKKYQNLNHCLYKKTLDTVVKDCTLSLNTPTFLSERLTFVDMLPKIDGYTYPINLYEENGSVYGYEMKYLDKHVDLWTYLNNNSISRLPFEIKKIALLKLLKCLKEINKEYIVSDININNIMFNQRGQSYLIDLENGYPIGTFYPTLEMYDTTFIKNGTQSDSLKLYICALSLLYEIDFGQLFKDIPYDRFCKIVCDININPIVCKFLEDLTYEFNINSNRTPYFDEYLNCIKNISPKEVDKVKVRALEEYYNDTLNVINNITYKQ